MTIKISEKQLGYLENIQFVGITGKLGTDMHVIRHSNRKVHQSPVSSYELINI